jgi:serine/threonine protein kinase
VAELIVMGDYQGPGEKKTAEALARELPGSWSVIFGRKLSGARRDDLDFIVIGEHTVFLLEEKYWGPRLVLGDQVWRVNGGERRNPLDRVNHLARVLAGQFRDRVPGYRAAVRGARLVIAAVVLSNDTVTVTAGPDYANDEPVLRLAEATRWLLAQDARYGPGIAPVRDELVAFLRGLPLRNAKPERIGPYDIVEEIEPIETAHCFHARNAGKTVLLRCYPMQGWGPDATPRTVIDRERVALSRLEERDRTWQIHPSFVDEARQWIVVPVVPASGRSLATSLRVSDPARDDGRLPRRVATDVVADAFHALAEVHAAGLLHRGLSPRRVFLGRGLRVKFSDFYLARVSGEQTIARDVTGTSDAGAPYRAPECRTGIALATQASDVYSLALALSGWILGELSAEPGVTIVRTAVATVAPIGPVLADCLADEPRDRPDAAEAAKRIADAEAAEAQRQAAATRNAEAAAQFTVGGVIDDRWEIRESLGVGGFARTWRAWDRVTGTDRVIKQFHDVLSDDARHEFVMADSIHYERCARVYDVHPGDPSYLVLEYVPGVSLRTFAADSPPEAERYRVIALDVLDGLAYLHARGMVHRDLTPNNVIVTPDGRAKLIDFGITSQSQATTVIGAPAFMAPEQRAGKGADARSDLYELGVTMTYAMLGRYPYAGDPERGDDDRRTLVPPTPDEREAWGPLGAGLLDVLFKLVVASPAQRLSSAEEVANQLRLVRDIPVVAGQRVVNPVVDSLRGLYRASGIGNTDNRGLDSDFAQRTYVPTQLDTELLPAIVAGEKRIVALTGNPGDGKTSFLMKVGERLRGAGAEVVEDSKAGWRMRLDGRTFVAVFDASESHEGKSSDELMFGALDPAPGDDPARRTVLLAINDGRLLQFFRDHKERYVAAALEVERLMAGQPANDPTVTLVDLKRRTLARQPGGGPSLARQVLGTFTDPRRWAACDGCLSRDVCPVRGNAETLRGPAADAVDELVATSYLRRQRRATFRDVRSALAWLITGDLACADVHAAREQGMDLRRGGARTEDLAFERRSADYLVREWADLDPADSVAPEVERAARADADIVRDPAMFSDQDRALAQRRLFFGTWRPELGRDPVRAYRYLGPFEEALLGERLTETRVLLLRGLSRLLGAPGYAGSDLAVNNRGPAFAAQGTDGAWAVLKEIPAATFTLSPVEHHPQYIEWSPDALRLRHEDRHSLFLTLDTFELVLRVADGDLIGDSADAAVLQEIETFGSALRRSPARSVRVVNPAGTERHATISADKRIVLEK